MNPCQMENFKAEKEYDAICNENPGKEYSSNLKALRQFESNGKQPWKVMKVTPENWIEFICYENGKSRNNGHRDT